MLRWEDYVERDARKAGEEEDWKKKTRDRGGWKRLLQYQMRRWRSADSTLSLTKGKEKER